MVRTSTTVHCYTIWQFWATLHGCQPFQMGLHNGSCQSNCWNLPPIEQRGVHFRWVDLHYSRKIIHRKHCFLPPILGGSASKNSHQQTLGNIVQEGGLTSKNSNTCYFSGWDKYTSRNWFVLPMLCHAPWCPLGPPSADTATGHFVRPWQSWIGRGCQMRDLKQNSFDWRIDHFRLFINGVSNHSKLNVFFVLGQNPTIIFWVPPLMEPYVLCGGTNDWYSISSPCWYRW